MLKSLKTNRLAAALLALGFVCALILCGARMVREAKNDRVCFIMTAEDMSLLDRAPEGVRVHDGGPLLDGAALLVEDSHQFSYDPAFLPEGGLDAACAVRCFYVYPQFADRVNYLGYQGPKEIENYLYRAITERNIRVVWFTPFADHDTGELITDAAQYESVVQGLASRLARHGLTVGDRFTAYEDYDPLPGYLCADTALMSLVFCGVIAAGCLLLCALCKPPKWLALTGLVIGPAAALLAPALSVQIFAFGAAVIFPALAMWYAADTLSAMTPGSRGRELLAYAGLLAKCVGLALAGGLFVGAIQSSSDYLLAVLNFRGVKLSQLLPPVFSVYLVLRFLCPLSEIRRSGKAAVALMAAALLCVGAYYILRSGDSSVSVWEQRARNWLENVLIARPRTKEFLAAWPCLAIACACLMRGARRYCWPFAIISSVGFCSVVNTFCHSRAPLWLSLTRTLTGVLLGGAIGLVLLTFSHRPVRKE